VIHGAHGDARPPAAPGRAVAHRAKSRHGGDPASGSPGRSRTARLVGLALLVLLLAVRPATAQPIVVGSKNFEESRLLAEMFARLLEERAGLEVERRFNLAGTQVCFEALRTGAIDLYPEYTGTGLVSLLGEPATADATTALNRVRRVFLERWDLWWLAPLGFENAYELAVRGPVARELELATISDLARRSAGLSAGLGFEFIERPDGLPGLAEAYGLTFAAVRPLQQALKYEAAAAGRIDVLDVYTTDGRLLREDLVVLEDDRGFFPSYQAAVLARGNLLREHPEVGPTLALLAGSLDEEAMRGFNLRLQEGGESPEHVAADALTAIGLVAAAPETVAAEGAGPGFWAFLWSERATLGRRTVEHLRLVAVALGLGLLVAVPLGLALERRRAVAEPVIRAVGVTQTIPSIALLAFMIPLLGVGALPAVVALWIYSLFPILRNTYTGVRDADAEAVESATALGMSPRQVLLWVRLPLAAPVILAGVRTAAVLTVGTATLAAFIGAGGLGEPIVTGLQLADSRLILSGALPAAALAILVDLLLAVVERRLTPAGLR